MKVRPRTNIPGLWLVFVAFSVKMQRVWLGHWKYGTIRDTAVVDGRGHVVFRWPCSFDVHVAWSSARNQLWACRIVTCRATSRPRRRGPASCRWSIAGMLLLICRRSIAHWIKRVEYRRYHCDEGPFRRSSHKNRGGHETCLYSSELGHRWRSGFPRLRGGLVDWLMTSRRGRQAHGDADQGRIKRRGHGAMPPPQTMDEKLKLSYRAYILVLQLPLMTIKQLINIAV